MDLTTNRESITINVRRCSKKYFGDEGGSARCEESIKVLSFNEDGRQRASTWVKYNDTIEVPEDYTMCLRFNIGVFRLLTAVVYLLKTSDNDDDPISFEVYFEKIRTKYGGYGRFYPLPANLATRKWYHYCQVRDRKRNEGRVYLDGQLIILEEKIEFQMIQSPREVTMGQDVFQPSCDWLAASADGSDEPVLGLDAYITRGLEPKQTPGPVMTGKFDLNYNSGLLE
ncbi:hypothetical protein SK128_000421 [Halocaridina rubra]|uniref:Uncharacterized protein n=1 Tax=Halocaridina rubra TaxID=373956 RepID=A0AAN8XI37_HALRR